MKPHFVHFTLESGNRLLISTIQIVAVIQCGLNPYTDIMTVCGVAYRVKGSYDDTLALIPGPEDTRT